MQKGYIEIDRNNFSEREKYIIETSEAIKECMNAQGKILMSKNIDTIDIYAIHTNAIINAMATMIVNIAEGLENKEDVKPYFDNVIEHLKICLYGNLENFKERSH